MLDFIFSTAAAIVVSAGLGCLVLMMFYLVVNCLTRSR